MYDYIVKQIANGWLLIVDLPDVIVPQTTYYTTKTEAFEALTSVTVRQKLDVERAE